MWRSESGKCEESQHESAGRHITGYATQELKLEAFSHENIGQLNTYVSWYARNVMSGGDSPPIGILLCTQKDHALVEYALAGMDNQLFVSKYQLHLPDREQLQKEVERTLKEER